MTQTTKKKNIMRVGIQNQTAQIVAWRKSSPIWNYSSVKKVTEARMKFSMAQSLIKILEEWILIYLNTLMLCKHFYPEKI